MNKSPIVTQYFIITLLIATGFLPVIKFRKAAISVLFKYNTLQRRPFRPIFIKIVKLNSQLW